jgi:hypothetical protein
VNAAQPYQLHRIVVTRASETGCQKDADERPSPTAADASIRRRLLTPTCRGLINAYVIVTHTKTAEVITARSTTLGYFNVQDLPTGDFYIISVNSKRYQFNNQSFILDENIDDLVLTANPNEQK